MVCQENQQNCPESPDQFLSALPHVEFWEDPTDVDARGIMDFRLGYAGDLLKAQGAGKGKRRVWEKHQIRLHFHHQLKNLWATHPLLKFYNQVSHFEGTRGFAGHHVSHHRTTIDSLAQSYGGYVPLVNELHGMYCDLDILFLRAEPVGNLLKHTSGGGDIDNRMKVLFDALGIPKPGQLQPKPEEDEPDPKPLFVLLSDDSLITSIKVTTDRLLTSEGSDDPAEACLILHVHVKSIDPLTLPYGLTI